MKTLIELYDPSNILNNLLATYVYSPNRVVFLSDGSKEQTAGVEQLRHALKERFQVLETFHVVLENCASAEKVCQRLCATYPDPVFDLTGGADAVSFAIALFCHNRVRPCICVDWQQRKLICNEPAEKYQDRFHIPSLYIEDILHANGAALQRKMHETPEPNLYEALTTFYEETLRSPKNWLSTCKYLQQVASKAEKEGHPLSFTSNLIIPDRGGKMLRFHPDFAKLAHRLGFFKELEIKKTTVSAVFTNEKILRYLTSQGTWLELYVYITAIQSGRFHDCRMSVVIDWDGIDMKRNNVINEIDVMLMHAARPIFISCKSSVPTTENLNEIYLYAKRLGGSHAKAMLVTTQDVEYLSPTVYLRAKELGVILVQRADLLRKDGLLQILENTTK